MKRQGFKDFRPYMEHFHEYWSFLGTLIDAEGCPGCRGDGGSPAYVRRSCARERRLDACPLCEDYPCEHYARLDGSPNYPTLKADNEYLREHGLAKWLEMQHQRRADGFTYIENREARE